MNLADFLFGAYRRDVLALLWMHPDESFHVREIARITGHPANTLYRELLALGEAGLLIRRQVGNQVHYRANTTCPIFEELRGILRKTAGVADVLREALAPNTPKVDLAFVYGSIASGEEHTGSDVDVLLIGKIGFEEAVRALSPAQQTLRREINPRVYTASELRRKLGETQGFIKRVLEGPKIFLIGDADDLRKLIKDKTAKAA